MRQFQRDYFCVFGFVQDTGYETMPLLEPVPSRSNRLRSWASAQTTHNPCQDVFRPFTQPRTTQLRSLFADTCSLSASFGSHHSLLSICSWAMALRWSPRRESIL